jgi:AraC-like DNA-binding protein
MRQSSGYGEEFGMRLRARTTAFVSHSLRVADIAVTEVKADNPEHGPSASQVREDAFLVTLPLRDYPAHQYWEDGKPAPASSLRAGDTVLIDMKRDPVFLINQSFHSVHFYFPRSALDVLADNAGVSRVDELRYNPGVGEDDPVIRGLTQALLPAFQQPENANRLFVEQIIMAVGIHTLTTYGGMTAEPAPRRGGLAVWQLKRAKEMLAAGLHGGTPLTGLAKECGLSPSHFARAFRQSAGCSPHQWLLKLRLDTAKSFLRNRALSLSEVAAACGFADQSHFTHVFTRHVGVSPGAWRRNVDERPNRN